MSLAEFEALVQTIRPELHRYCTRMIGSVIDAEDVVQEALTKAYTSLPTTSIGNMRAWLFRIAHNKAIDHLRRANQQQLAYLDEQTLLVEEDPPLQEHELVAAALSTFLLLAPKQRSCVILKDVLGYSLADISELLNIAVPEIKAALHRGRTRLRELAPHVLARRPAPPSTPEQQRLAHYIERFNARDFDAVRSMLADHVELDLVNKIYCKGSASAITYFHHYGEVNDTILAPGIVEQRPGILVYDRFTNPHEPIYFVMLQWQGDKVVHIRDFRHARYVMRDAAVYASPQGGRKPAPATPTSPGGSASS